MKYITISKKDYFKAKSKKLDVVPSSNISIQKDFHKDILLKTQKLLNQIKTKDILSRYNLSEELTYSLHYNLKFFFHQKLFEYELTKRSEREIWKSNKEKRKINNICDYKRSSIFKFFIKIFHNIVDFNSLFFFKVLLFFRCLLKKGDIIVSYPNNGLQSALHNLGIEKRNILYLVPNKDQFILIRVIKFILGGQYLPFYPRKLDNRPLKDIDENIISDEKIISNKKLNKMISNWIIQRERDYLISKTIIFFLQPKVFISQQSLDKNAVMALAFKKNEISSLLISHGSHIVNSDLLAMHEWKYHSRTMLYGPFSFSVLQSPAAKKFYQHQNLKIKSIQSKPLIIWNKNNILINNDRKKLYGISAEKKILLYASTPKFEGSLRPYIYETEDEYINNIISLIKLISKRKDLHLAIRHRETKELSKKDLLQCLPKSDNYYIYVDGNFESYLASSDLLISYSSTTIEQALFAFKKVLLWDSLGRYTHVDNNSLDVKGLKGVWFASISNFQSILKEALDFDLYYNKKTFQQIYYDYLSSANNEKNLNKYI